MVRKRAARRRERMVACWTCQRAQIGQSRYESEVMMVEADEIEKLRRRVAVLETVIYEDLHPVECSDDMNLMIVEDIIKRRSVSLSNGNRE